MRRLRTGPLTQALPLLEVRWRRVALAVGLGSVALGSAVGLASVSAWLIARASQTPPILTLSVAIVSVRAFGISRGVFRYAERLASHDIALRGMSALRTNLYTALAKSGSDRVTSLRRGDVLARVGADVDTVGDAVVKSIVPVGVAAVISTGTVVLVGVFLPWAGLTLAACLALAGIVAPWLAARSARTVEARGAAARGKMTAIALETLEAAGPLAVSGRMEGQSAALRAADHHLARIADDGARTAGLSAGLLSAAVGLAVLASLLLGIPAVEAGQLAPVELAVIVLTPLAAFEAASALPAAAVQWHRSSQAAQRVLELVGSGPHSATRSPGSATSGLALRGVSCGWPASARPTVAGVDLDLAPGKAVAVVGPSGIGKTTLLMTAAGLLAPTAGTVTLDGLDPAESASDGPRRAVFVAEDGHVFDTTILENLRVARGDASATEASGMLARVGLGDWLATLPDGLDTMLGADATTISGGERRRLLIARALLAPARYLLVDEPAEHLDGPTADALLHLLARTTREDGRAMLIATHRLTTLDAVDEVIALGRGADGAARVIARGTHTELLDLPEYQWALAQEQVV